MVKYLDYGLEGRGAIITGGGTGIGEACAIELAKAGVKVAVFGRRIEPVEDTAAKCNEFCSGAIALSVDVSEKDQVDAAVDKVAQEFGRLDILINNAGIEVPYQVGEVPFINYFDTDPESYIKFYKVHALGHYMMMQAACKCMVPAKFGRITNVTSVTALTASYSAPAYTGSKAATICQTKAFAQKYGEHNITVNSIAPGMVDTPMKTNSPQEERDFVANMAPLKRIAEPIDVARLAVYLSSEDLFLTGQNIVMDGGSTM